MTMNLNSSNSASVASGSGDDWLDGLLAADAREERSAYIADEGFTARVMRALPAPLALPKWRKPAVFALWGVALAGVSLALPSAVVDVAREAYRLLGAQPVSLSGMVGALLFAGALSWSAAAFTLRNSD